jgi:hypothetical protein
MTRHKVVAGFGATKRSNSIVVSASFEKDSLRKPPLLKCQL